MMKKACIAIVLLLVAVVGHAALRTTELEPGDTIGDIMLKGQSQHQEQPR
jgi:hypothetical protein